MVKSSKDNAGYLQFVMAGDMELQQVHSVKGKGEDDDGYIIMKPAVEKEDKPAKNIEI